MSDPVELTCRPPNDFYLNDVRSVDDLPRALSHTNDTDLKYENGLPFLFDLNILEGPEWACTEAWIKTLPPATQTEIRKVIDDLKAANTDTSSEFESRYVTAREISDFMKKNEGRWKTPAQFRMAADHLLNILPNYMAAGTKLTKEELEKTWFLLNFYAKNWKDLDHPMSLFGIDLTGFPSEDADNPPAFIQRLLKGQISPRELAAVHLLLKIPVTEESDTMKVHTEGGAPLTPTGLEFVDSMLTKALQEHGNFLGMMLINTPEDESQRMTQCGQAMEAGNICDALPIDYVLNGSPSAAEYEAMRTWTNEKRAASLTMGDDMYALLAKMGMPGLGTIVRHMWNNPEESFKDLVTMIAAFKTAHHLLDKQIYRRSFIPAMRAKCGGNLTEDQMEKAWKAYNNRPYKSALARRTLGFLNKTIPQIALFIYLSWKKHELMQAMANGGTLPQSFVDNYFASLGTDLLLFVPLFEAFESLGRGNKQEFLSSHADLCPPKEAPAAEPMAAAEPVAAAEPAVAPVAETPAARVAVETVFDPAMNYTPADPWCEVAPQYSAAVMASVVPAVPSTSFDSLFDEADQLIAETRAKPFEENPAGGTVTNRIPSAIGTPHTGIPPAGSLRVAPVRIPVGMPAGAAAAGVKF